jgi:hypothetical protein
MREKRNRVERRHRCFSSNHKRTGRCQVLRTGCVRCRWPAGSKRSVVRICLTGDARWRVTNQPPGDCVVSELEQR